MASWGEALVGHGQFSPIIPAAALTRLKEVGNNRGLSFATLTLGRGSGTNRLTR